jgi:hypothetical protein
VGFEGGLTQLPSPRAQCPVRPVPAKIDYAVSGFGDDAGYWFLVGMVADPWVLECRANVHLGTLARLICTVCRADVKSILRCRACGALCPTSEIGAAMLNPSAFAFYVLVLTVGAIFWFS